MDGAAIQNKYFISNTLANKTLIACEEILGNGGVHSVLNHAHLPHLIEHYPPDNLDKTFPYSDYAAIMTALEDVYGKRGGKIMGICIGRVVSRTMIENFGLMLGVSDPAFKALPLAVRVGLVLIALSKVLGQVTDLVPVVKEHIDSFDFVVSRCPICWKRHGENIPVCFSYIGLLQGLLNWVSDGQEFDVEETACCAVGDASCVFRVSKTPVEEAG